MEIGFIYIWRDKARNMFYVGSHKGTPDDGYVSTSPWMNGELRYRPQDFRRRILKFLPLDQLRKEEHRILKMINKGEHGVRYYNDKQGRPHGSTPPNKGKPMSDEQRKKISEARTGIPKSEEHRRKISEACKGRKISDEHRTKISEAAKAKRVSQPA